MSQLPVKYQPKRVAKSEIAAYAGKVEYLTEEEYSALLNAASGHPEHILLMRLLWETGLRISEALGLRFYDIYPDQINLVGKGRKQRVIPCQAAILGELLRFQQAKEYERAERVFQSIRTEPGALRMLRRYAKKIGLGKRIYPHLFRHSFAINVMRQTGNPFALQDLLGHANMEMVKVYMRLAQDGPREAINKMHFPE